MSAEGLQAASGLVGHLPVLQVLVPFVAAPLTVLVGMRRLAWPMAFVASALSLLIASAILAQVLQGGPVSYALGGWAPPLGIEYRVDAANGLILFLVSAVSTVVLFFARRSVEKEIPPRHHALFYTAWLLSLSGLLGVTVTGDAFNVFVFLEVSSLSTYVLVAMGAGRDRRALTAAYDYLMMGTTGATFFVIGIGFLYAATGTLNMADIADQIAANGLDRTVRTAFAFIVVGIGLKVAIYPLHLWLPNAYTYAPSAVTAFIGGTATKVAVYVLLRFMFTVFRPEVLFEVRALDLIMIPLALLAMFAASLIAIFQTDFKRMLAYSSIAQIGYILLGIGFLSETGLTAAIIHLFNHGITKAALFMGVGALVWRRGSSFYGRIEGMGRIMPWTSFAVVIAGLSLIGVPGTAGFISKWVLVQAAIEKGWWPVAIAIVVSSLLAVVYVWRVVETLYMKQPNPKLERGEAPLSMVVPIWIAALATVWFGFSTDITLGAASAAAKGLLAGFGGVH
jgi:multicomponent Na+:H+ antiporter subunit D